jgi:hypothetical protein
MACNSHPDATSGARPWELRPSGQVRPASTFLEGKLPKVHPRMRAARADAFRWAMASMEIMGLTPEADGNEEPSIT